MKNRKKIIGQIWTYFKKIMLFLLFIKKELKNKYNIKIQGGAIVNEEN